MAVNNKIVTVGHVTTVNLDTDRTMAAGSDSYVATQKAVKDAMAYSTVFSPVQVTASGALPDASFVQLNNTSAMAVTVAAPTPGRILIITQIDAGTAGHTVTLAAGTWDGINDVATFNAAGETLILVGVSATRYGILLNIGSVGLS